MRVYCVTFDLNNRSSKTVYVSKNSTFQIGIKCYKDGQLLAPGSLDAPNGTTLKSSGTLADYTTWTLTSGPEEAAEQYSFTAYYKVPHPVFGSVAAFVKLPPLTIITTSSDVAEIQQKEDLSGYWKKSDTEEHQLSGTYEDGSEFSLTAICKKA